MALSPRNSSDDSPAPQLDYQHSHPPPPQEPDSDGKSAPSPRPKAALSGPAAAAIAAFPGLLCFLIALGFDPLVHEHFDTDPAFKNYSDARIWLFTQFFISWGLVCLGAAILMGRRRPGAWLARRPLVLGMIFSLHLLFVMLAAADGALGVRGCYPPIPDITYHHTKYFYRMIPAFDRLPYANDLTYDVLHRPLTPADKTPPGRKRVIFMGDSVVYGDRIPANKTLPFRLDQQLGPNIEVLNAGKLGYGFEHYYYYAHDLVRLKPDLVILGICLNDLSMVTDARLEGDPSDPDCAIQRVTSLNMIRWWANQHSGLINADRAFRKHMFPSSNTEIGRYVIKGVTTLLDNREYLQHQTNTARPYLREMAALMREHDIPFVAVIFPFEFQYQDIMKMAFPHQLVLQETVMGLCEENGIPALDLYEPLGSVVKQMGGHPELMFLDYNHFNTRGTAILAETMRPWVMGLLEGETRKVRENDENKDTKSGE